jgi:CubicO group peptidase (beta-lactamase class C family)
MRRLFLHVLWVGPVAIFGILLLYAGCDVRYLARVLVRQGSNTDDYQWKRAMPVAPAPSPARWPETHGCDAVSAAFAPERDGPELASYLTRGGALAFVVVRDGALACEWYGNGGAQARPAAAFSISKSVTSLLLARAVAAGKIRSLDDAITEHVPELAARDPRFSAITLAALVDMRSGIAFDEDVSFPWVNGDSPRVYYASDLARTVVEQTRIEMPPGGFVYNDYAPNLIGLALDRAYGARLASGPMQALWSELGAEHGAAWSVDDHDFAWHESGLVVTARDLARVGQLMLDDGKVGDRQVAPPAFVARSFAPAGRKPIVNFAGVELGYRNGWWILGEQELLAMGRHGQVMFVSRATRTVIVRLGLDGHDDLHRLGFDGHNETNVSIGLRFRRVAARLAH